MFVTWHVHDMSLHILLTHLTLLSLLLADLQPGATYFYRVCGDLNCEVKEFKVSGIRIASRSWVLLVCMQNPSKH